MNPSPTCANGSSRGSRSRSILPGSTHHHLSLRARIYPVAHALPPKAPGDQAPGTKIDALRAALLHYAPLQLMNGHIYYHARVCTGDHKRFANLPRYAANVLVELPSDKRGQATSLVVKLAGKCLEQRFNLSAFIRRVTETDLIFLALPPKEPTTNCDYQDENGRVWIVQDLSDRFSKGRNGVKQPSQEPA